MADILHDLTVDAPPAAVFEAVSTPAGLDTWWTWSCTGRPARGETFVLGFTPEYKWLAQVTRYEPLRVFELTLTDAQDDWRGTRVLFDLEPVAGGTVVHFSHMGWADSDAHFRQSSFCWALYLNVMRRHLESGIETPYDARGGA